MENIKHPMVDTLCLVKKFLDKQKVAFWLDFGTLLGAVREGGFIAWDHDIDIGTWATNTDAVCKLCEKLQEKGFVFSLTSSHRMLLVREFKGEQISVDIMLYHVKGDKASLSGSFLHYPVEYLAWILKSPADDEIVNSGFFTKAFARISRLFSKPLRKYLYELLWFIPRRVGYLRHLERDAPKRFFENLSTISFYGMGVLTPSPVEDYLHFRYGQNWRTPMDEETFYWDLDSMGGK